MSCSREGNCLTSFSSFSNDCDVSDAFKEVDVIGSDTPKDNSDGAAEEGTTDDTLHAASGEDIDDDSSDEFISHDDGCDLSEKLGGSMMTIDRDRRS